MKRGTLAVVCNVVIVGGIGNIIVGVVTETGKVVGGGFEKVWVVAGDPVMTMVRGISRFGEVEDASRQSGASGAVTWDVSKVHICRG